MICDVIICNNKPNPFVISQLFLANTLKLTTLRGYRVVFLIKKTGAAILAAPAR